MGGVGEAVEAEGQRPVLGPVGQVGEVDAVGGDAELFHGPEGSPRPAAAPSNVLATVRSHSSASGAPARARPTATAATGGTPRACWSRWTASRHSSSTWGPACARWASTSSRPLRESGLPLRATALLTHLHYDHILGLPFFSPHARPGSPCSTSTGRPRSRAALDEVLSGIGAAAVLPHPHGASSGASSASTTWRATTTSAFGGTRSGSAPSPTAATRSGSGSRPTAGAGLPPRPPGPGGPPDGRPRGAGAV